MIRKSKSQNPDLPYLSRLAGKEKSSKHLKAEALIQSGQPIRVLAESDFMKLISS
jgi:DNA polymerase-3 subunit epsilon